MYQTPQGLVYAGTPTGTPGVAGLPEGFVLNLPQTPLPAVEQGQGE